VTLFQSIKSKLQYWKKSDSELFVRGAQAEQWALMSQVFLKEELFNNVHLQLFSTPEEAEDYFETIKNKGNVLYYPGLGHGLYEAVVSSESLMIQRWGVIEKLLANEKCQIISTLDAVLLLGPDKDFIKNNSLEIKVDDIISPYDLTKKLVEIGYHSTGSVEEPGTFSRKGEIFDIFPYSHPPIRIQYFDDLIEKMTEINLETQKSIKDKTYSSLKLMAGAGLFTAEKHVNTLRQMIPQPQPSFKNKFEKRKNMFLALGQQNLFESYPVFTPLFFDQPMCLLDFLPTDCTISFFNREDCYKNFEIKQETEQEHFNLAQAGFDSDNILPEPGKFYRLKLDKIKFRTINIESLNINYDIDQKINHEISLSLEKTKMFLQNKLSLAGVNIENRFEFIKKSLAVLKKELDYQGHLIICYKTESAKTEIRYLLEENGLGEYQTQISFLPFDLHEGFVYATERVVVLSEGDFFASKKKKTKALKSTNTDLFAEQMATLKVNDYVMHRDFGIGVYKGLETIEAGDQKNDFLVLIYEGNDKVYVPVYKLHLIQKHADGSSGVKVASLKSKKFNELKQKARNSVKTLAFDLLRLQAERKLKGGFPFSPPDHLYKEFELSFAFEETPDQEKAIFDVIEDMQKPYPMDRLICGDVGFGKTEVALRAAMKAVLDKKQVVVLVPTTVLALQHYHSFKKRFKDFPVVVDFVSRFKSAKEKNQTIQLVNEGKVDILVGTHAVLSEKIDFQDLGLLIIDEEHRFGVGHKEKLKVLKTGIDVLTMTATPIPRTLQLSFLGIRDLSLIQTAPPRRQAIKTYLIKEDDLTIKSAIEKELSRGGQVYFVHNRVHDIEEYELYLKKLVPKARITVTHGQMNERELEKRISDFYEHKSDILLATTIIESGIDIPNANTMIIDRADTYGLAQLHQLRGRIGRSDRKAYAYFVVPENRILTETAQKRLHALQTYAEMGSGFALASSDMEIRGAGDILGAEQSGHIESIGLEFYMDLLEEAINEIRGEIKSSVKNIEIQAAFSAFIPNNYIEDHALRLKYYKRLSNCSDLNRLEDLISEMNDAFGVTPRELEALYCILRSRLYFLPIGLRLVKVAGTQMHLFFEAEILNRNPQLRDKVLNLFMNKPKLYKLNPDTSVTCYFKENIDHQTLLEFAKHIAGQMGVC